VKTAVLAAVLLLLAVMLAATPASAAVALRFTPQDTTVTIDDVTTVSIWIDEPIDLRTIDVVVRYTANYATGLDGEQGALFDGLDCYVWEEYESAGWDRWHGAAVAIGSDCWATGPGELFRWTFQATRYGTVTLHAVEVTLYDPQANLIEDVTLPPATIQVHDPDMVTTDHVPPAVASLRLHPNPFNPGTSVVFALPQAGPARIDVFDPRGRYVDTIWQRWTAAGVKSVPWNATDSHGSPLASGVYVFRLESARGVSQITRGILVK